MEQEEPFIPIDEQINKFNTLLKNNNRLFFSAKFGDGKTTFLNEFKKEKQDEYQIITLFPINYQIVDNKDIFELIKRDILLQLLMLEDIELEENDITFSGELYMYLTNNKTNIAEDLLISAASLFSNTPILHNMKEPLKRLFKNIDRFKTQKQEIEEKTNDIVKVDKFLDQSNICIYEFDAISQLIHTLIKQYREKTKKDIVLIIEDLDRIDPKHLFRLLNIFSAHFDRVNKGIEEKESNLTDNKFGFDKIVFVCDYDNIENIYHHFYGNNTDFKGYITKFSSVQPFIYSLKELYYEYIFSILPKEISKFNSLSDLLSDMIIEQFYSEDIKESEKDSLRTIRDNIINYKPHIEEKEIINRYDTSLKVNSINDFTKLLDILLRFNIDLNNFIEHINSQTPEKEFLNMIEESWELSEYSLVKRPFGNRNLVIKRYEITSNDIELKNLTEYSDHYLNIINLGLRSIIENINDSDIFTNKFLINYNV